MTFSAEQLCPLTAGRRLWSEIEDEDDEEEAAVIFSNEAAAPVAETLAVSTPARTFRTTRIVVRDVANMEHKTYMCHTHDDVLHLKGLIFSKIGVPTNRQRLVCVIRAVADARTIATSA